MSGSKCNSEVQYQPVYEKDGKRAECFDTCPNSMRHIQNAERQGDKDFVHSLPEATALNELKITAQ